MNASKRNHTQHIDVIKPITFDLYTLLYVVCRCHVGAGFAGLLLCFLPLRFNVVLFINLFVLRQPLNLGEYGDKILND